MVKKASYQIILDLTRSPIGGTNNQWSWYKILGDSEGIIFFLKVFSSDSPRFSLLIPPGIDIDDLTVAKEKAREIIKSPVCFLNDLYALLSEGGEEAVVALFPYHRLWDRIRQFERFLELSTNSPPALVVLPSRWRSLLPGIKRQTHLRVKNVKEEGGLICCAYMGYENGVSHKKEEP